MRNQNEFLFRERFSEECTWNLSREKFEFRTKLGSPTGWQKELISRHESRIQHYAWHDIRMCKFCDKISTNHYCSAPHGLKRGSYTEFPPPPPDSTPVLYNANCFSTCAQWHSVRIPSKASAIAGALLVGRDTIFRNSEPWGLPWLHATSKYCLEDSTVAWKIGGWSTLLRRANSLHSRPSFNFKCKCIWKYRNQLSWSWRRKEGQVRPPTRWSSWMYS